MVHTSKHATRFEGIGPDLAGYEKHRKRVGGDIGHILEQPPAPNRLLIGGEDWAVPLPWRPTRHGLMREVILTVNKAWFDADPAAVFGEGVEHNQRIVDFEERSIAWLKDAFGDDVIHARADLDEEAYHIQAVIMPRVQVEMTRTDKKTGEKKVIATRLMLQPSKFDVIEDYEHAQDSVSEWFSEIGLDRGERRKAAYREAIAKGETPPPKRMRSKTRDWWRKKDLELAKRERDLETRSAVVEEKVAEAETIIEITETVAQGAVDPSAPSAEDALVPVKGREQDEMFLRAQRHAQRSPKGASRLEKAFRRGWWTVASAITVPLVIQFLILALIR